MLDLLFDRGLVFGLLGGLGLFLFGMRTLSEGLQKISGQRLRIILTALTANRFVGALVGLLVTAAIQSSGATTVMAVGFVNAGLMSLVQAIGVILGANVGTTLTAQLLAFNLGGLALPAIGVGALLKLFSKNRKWSYYGEIILGFGLLFFGFGLMKQAFDPVKQSETFRHFFTLVGDNHLLGVAVGALVTVLVQSSTATIGLTIALASSGLLSFEGSVALILGENIGTTITANLAAVGANLNAKRTALCHLLVNVTGVTYMLLLFPFFTRLVAAMTPGDADFIVRTVDQARFFAADIGDKPHIARHVANAHSLFNLINTLLFLPLVHPLARLATMLLPGTDRETAYMVKYIDRRVLNTPPIALGQARSETRRMGRLTHGMLADTIAYIGDQDDTRIDNLERCERLIDHLQREITDFLVALSQKSVSQQTSAQIASLLNVVNDLERIGDHCFNLVHLNQRRSAENIVFSPTAVQELNDIAERTRSFLSVVLEHFDQNDTRLLADALRNEEEIDRLEAVLRQNHISRLNTGECAVLPGLLFIEMIQNFEKIADHTFKIARSLYRDE
ncbi:phosphate:Na+ symporter [Geothermobacter ehrlichii]|uniref:Phosphate:Na+ symporter n=1 Tax=Geothermobacter ehrlichii TaxID=213224 RepID=A0A5D3WRV9_9BACT|nr:Na/Pi cotransporter family protein [Geothermobacter ehrlichii]TYP00329.1 phosphate:Na+ symporter [Geothermobacter ehrlichii]